MFEDKCKRAPSRSGRRQVRSSGPLRAVVAVAGFAVLCLVVEYVVIPAVLRTVLVLADGISVALGMGSVL